ncbi:MAG: PDZ domain-containing protein [Gemmatimonadales bacterium]
MRLFPVLPALLILPTLLGAQNPLERPTDGVEVRYAITQPVVQYIIHVDSTDLSGFQVEIRLAALPDTFTLAMVRHPELDDRYWRFVKDLRAETASGPGTVTRVDDGQWRVTAPGGRAIVRYRMQLPPPQPLRAAWKPFLARDGGLVGGTQSLLYIANATLAPAIVTLDLPAGWNAATGLEPTSDPHTYFAPTVGVLVDSPILIGSFSDRHFFIDGVPHRIVYWSLAGTPPFDTLALTRGIEGVARQAIAIFGRAPYREYTFLLQDNAYGALEHLNSLTLGAPSTDLAKDPTGLLEEIAHEYFHAWNLLRIRPAEWGDVSYRVPKQPAELWVSEGITMYYADLMLRRAGLPVEDSTRADHFARLMERYLAQRSGYTRYTAEQVSRAANEAPGALGDYVLSTHLQGELLGTLLDWKVRTATRGQRSLDDVMRRMMVLFSGAQGFTDHDFEATAEAVCGCKLAAFFAAYVRGHRPIPFDDYLQMIGMRAEVSWAPARDDSGQQRPDLRVAAWMAPGARNPTLMLLTPESAWAAAGLHTGDRVLRLDGTPIADATEFRAALGKLKVGQPAQLAIERGGQTEGIRVVIRGYDVPTVTLVPIGRVTARERALAEAWLAGTP